MSKFNSDRLVGRKSLRHCPQVEEWKFLFAKLSVKRPYTVFVAVVLTLVLGIISFFGLTTDLLPNLELPYVIAVTTYPGASPEKVELSVTKPLESVLGTTSGLANISSVSQENTSMVILEFAQGTNMDSAMIELSDACDLVSGQLDDAVSNPMLLKISPDMMPIMVASIDMDGMNTAEISSFVGDVVSPAFERIDGVASVGATGLIKEQLTVTPDADKIDALNEQVLRGIDRTLADAQNKLREGNATLTEGKQKLADGKIQLTNKKNAAFSELAAASTKVDSASAQLSALLAQEQTLAANKAAFEAEQAGYL
ncbi:MAG: efflux RND transporter permease subunit, partial [Pygmaiobacter sp.]